MVTGETYLLLNCCLKMAVYTVFSHPILQKYKAHIFSRATVIQLLITLLTLILPLLIAYRSDGFWIKEIRNREQPKITFKKELIFVLHLSNNNQSYVTYSTFQNYNNLQQQFLRIPLIKALEKDITGDGLSDSLELSLEIPLFDSEQVVGVELLLFFTYEIRKFSRLFMESMAYIQYSFAVPGAKLQVLGNLKIQQKELLSFQSIDRRYNIPIVDSKSIFSDAYDLSKIIQQFNKRNVTTELVPPYYTWIIGRGAGKPFIISTTIKYIEDEIVSSFLYQLKWGWVQYLCALIPVIFLFDKLKIFLFSNRLMNTIISNSFKSQGLKSY